MSGSRTISGRCSLPALTWTERLTLLLIQFNLTFDLSPGGDSIQLVDVPENVVATRQYPVSALGAEKVEVLARQFPETALRQQGDQIVAEGSVEALEALFAGTTTRRTKTKTTTPGRQVYKLSTEQPLAALVEELGKRLDLDFQFDREAISRRGISLDQTVSVKVENVSLEELIEAVLAPAGLVGNRPGRTVRVVPALNQPAGGWSASPAARSLRKALRKRHLPAVSSLLQIP